MGGYHRHNDIELNLVTEGRLVYRFGGATVVVETGELAAFWAALPHQLVSNEGVRTMRWLTLPLVHFLRWRLPARVSTAILGGRVLRSRAAAGSQADALRLAQWALDLSAEEPEAQAAALLEIEARLRRMIPGETEAARRAARDPSKAGRMSRHIATHFATLGSIAEVAEQVGLRPNYAMTLFKDAFGVTILDHLIHYRVAHAQQLLITTDRKVLDIALDSGFSSLSRFNVAFKRVCGLTPRAYRAQRDL
jgi:AraC-like DNA-binding protein